MRFKFEVQGCSIPAVGLGSFRVPTQANCRCSSTKSYRNIETAAAYGYGNEKEVGKAIEGSGIPRDEIFVTTKL